MSSVTSSLELTADEVNSVYVHVLGREAENSAVVASCIKRFSNRYELALSLARSAEFRFKSLSEQADLPIPERLVLVACHHKTGTEWMGDIFRRVGRFTSMSFFNGTQGKLNSDNNIFMQVDSLFEFKKLPPFRGIHIIRDPRDIIISGALYHESSQEEAWLSAPMAELGGMSYQEKLRSMPTLREKLSFEMDNRGQKTINQLKSWEYHNPDFIEIKYEDLIRDSELLLFLELFKFLGFRGLTLALCLEIAWLCSLFSGRVAKQGVHVRSGIPRQWRNIFTRETGIEFVSRFGDVLVQLGYETDNSWVDSLAPKPS